MFGAQMGSAGELLGRISAMEAPSSKWGVGGGPGGVLRGANQGAGGQMWWASDGAGVEVRLQQSDSVSQSDRNSMRHHDERR